MTLLSPSRAMPIDDIAFMVKADEIGRRAAFDVVRERFSTGSRGRLRPEGVIHATLVLAGKADDPRTVTVAYEVATLVRSRGFTLVFDTLIGFGGRDGVLALTCSATPSEWLALRRQLSQAPRRLGLRTVGGATPHLTVGYGFAAVPQTRLVEPVVWTVDAFMLVRSLTGQSKHDELGRWALE